MSGSRLLADSGLYRTVIQFSDTARHLVHILVYIEVLERRTVGRGGGNPDLLHSTLLIVLPHRLLLLQVQPSIYTEVKVIGNVLLVVQIPYMYSNSTAVHEHKKLA